MKNKTGGKLYGFSFSMFEDKAVVFHIQPEYLQRAYWYLQA